MSGDGTLNEAYERLHRLGPEFEGWLTNHAPMAAESLVAHGHEDVVHRWLDQYVGQLEEKPRGLWPIDPAEWRPAMGDPHRLGDWLTFFEHEVDSRPWREVLETWWPRLLPGIAAGATHGVIRTGHAVRALLLQEDAPRLAEFAQALGYWAARWQSVPGVVAPAGTADFDAALDAVPQVPEQARGINHRLDQLAGLGGWSAALASLEPAADPGEARRRLTRLADAATLRYLSHGHGSGIMLVHTATAPTAVLRTLPALPRSQWVDSFNAAWAASAAVVAAYGPAEPLPGEALPVAAHTPEEVFEQAVEHADAHVIKLADTALDVFERTGDRGALSAVVHAGNLIQRPGD
ncbi:questin oxidase family protein [Nonomuraea longicatena]|uniref:Questin oxidase family protein n=1 Tax=Nonomuraea longicatena TaxID=83682 RepID=A0ABN1Q134_9ACTN